MTLYDVQGWFYAILSHLLIHGPTITIKRIYSGDFPGGPEVKTLHFLRRGSCRFPELHAGSILDGGT